MLESIGDVRKYLETYKKPRGKDVVIIEPNQVHVKMSSRKGVVQASAPLQGLRVLWNGMEFFGLPKENFSPYIRTQTPGQCKLNGNDNLVQIDLEVMDEKPTHFKFEGDRVILSSEKYWWRMGLDRYGDVKPNKEHIQNVTLLVCGYVDLCFDSERFEVKLSQDKLEELRESFVKRVRCWKNAWRRTLTDLNLKEIK